MEGNQLQLDHDQMKVLISLSTGEDFMVSEGTLEDNGHGVLSYSVGEMACSVEPAYQIVLRDDYIRAIESADLMYPLTTVQSLNNEN
jgi:hypothetical protein